MLLHIRLELLEELLQGLDPVHMPAVCIPELHHHLQTCTPSLHVPYHASHIAVACYHDYLEVRGFIRAQVARCRC